MDSSADKNETQFIIDYIIDLLHTNGAIDKKGVRALGLYYGFSHVAIYDMIKKDRITIKFFKQIKTNIITQEVAISDNYIVNHILLGL